MDAGTDVDTDSDTDTDMNTESNTDTDQDTSTDRDTDSDTHTVSDSGTGTGSDSDTVTNIDTETGLDTETALPSTCDGMPASTIHSFDTDTAGWEIFSKVPIPMSLSWEDSAGTPIATGVARVDADPGEESAFFGYVMPTTDLTDAILSMRVLVAAGTDVQMKVYVQAGATYEWADSGQYAPGLNSWTCVSLDVTAPAFQDKDFNPGEVIEVGLEILGGGPLTVYVDDVRY